MVCVLLLLLLLLFVFVLYIATADDDNVVCCNGRACLVVYIVGIIVSMVVLKFVSHSAPTYPLAEETIVCCVDIHSFFFVCFQLHLQIRFHLHFMLSTHK